MTKEEAKINNQDVCDKIHENIKKEKIEILKQVEIYNEDLKKTEPDDEWEEKEKFENKITNIITENIDMEKISRCNEYNGCAEEYIEGFRESSNIISRVYHYDSEDNEIQVNFFERHNEHFELGYFKIQLNENNVSFKDISIGNMGDDIDVYAKDVILSKKKL